MKPLEKLFSLAQNAYDLNDYQGAVSYLEQILEVEPQNEKAMVRLAFIEKDLERYDKAKYLFKKGILISSKKSLSYLGLGLTLERLGEYKEAERVLKKSIDLEPSSNKYVILGFVQEALKLKVEAKQSYKKAIKLDPNFEEAYYKLACLIGCKEPEKALGLLEKAISLDANYALAHAELGAILGSLKRIKEAEKRLKKALELGDNQHWTHLYLANVLWRLKKNEEAESEYLAACALDKSSLSHLSLAQFYEDMGNLKAAGKNYESAVEIDPKDEKAIKELERFLSANNRVKSKKSTGSIARGPNQ